MSENKFKIGPIWTRTQHKLHEELAKYSGI